jgi:hypothetical protein
MEHTTMKGWCQWYGVEFGKSEPEGPAVVDRTSRWYFRFENQDLADATGSSEISRPG